ncbi:hypothetical protein [Paraburkholderia tagetis]|uniref:Uncharacterized protein n=1 Tax=Paraburkholderia tagetis TaxID=2913261 RepID=A0A9X1UPE5_9BURK|nr:hypothetical protein [Paraburkholderia tagetis]MCG5079048.1 hypothetical protein [Paraburkholderia tagetis]
MLFDFRKDAALASLVVEQHIFFTMSYLLLWARAHNNEKGRVERAIRFVRSSFFAARKFTDIDDLNAQAAQWCATVAADRPCPDEPDITVREAFEREKGSLLALPVTDRRYRANP